MEISLQHFFLFFFCRHKKLYGFCLSLSSLPLEKIIPTAYQVNFYYTLGGGNTFVTATSFGGLKYVVCSRHVYRPPKLVSLSLVVDFLDRYIVFFTPGDTRKIER